MERFEWFEDCFVVYVDVVFWFVIFFFNNVIMDFVDNWCGWEIVFGEEIFVDFGVMNFDFRVFFVVFI